MLDQNYLTPNLKKYYLLDFEQVVLIKDAFWGIPEVFLKEVLTVINASENIQSLYSKLKYENDPEDEESYLVIAYSKKIEVQLQEKLTTYAATFPNHTISIEHLSPSQNLNIGPTDYQIGAIHNKNYFNIHHFRITFLSDTYTNHLEFWITMKDLLVNI